MLLHKVVILLLQIVIPFYEYSTVHVPVVLLVTFRLFRLFHFRAFKNNVTENILFLSFGVKLDILFGIDLIELLDHRACILALVNTAEQFLKVSVPISNSQQQCIRFPLFCIFINACFKILTFWCDCNGVSLWINLHLPNN